MRSGEEFEEDGRVDGQITADTKTPKSCETSNCSEIWRSSRDQTEYCCDTKGEIECQSAPEDIASKSPEHCTSEKTDILGQGEKGRTGGQEFVRDGRHWRTLVEITKGLRMTDG